MLVWVFQYGHFESFSASSRRGPSPRMPLFLFIVLFGLSMDYHVFSCPDPRGIRSRPADRGGGRDGIGARPAWSRARPSSWFPYSRSSPPSAGFIKEFGIGLAARCCWTRPRPRRAAPGVMRCSARGTGAAGMAGLATADRTRRRQGAATRGRYARGAAGAWSHPDRWLMVTPHAGLRRLVRVHWEQEVAGSNPAAPMSKENCLRRHNGRDS